MLRLYGPPEAQQGQSFNGDDLFGRGGAAMHQEVNNRTSRMRPVLDQIGYTTLPAFGAEAEFGGRDVLVLGFVWTPEQGPLDRFMVWAFARESCDTVWYRAGPVTKERP
jgi:hypothetical protein